MADLISLISSHTQHVMEHVTMSTCSSSTMGGGVGIVLAFLLVHHLVCY